MADSAAKRMNRALKRALVPALAAAGFAGRYPRYRRVEAARIAFVAVFHDKAGTRFFLEFGTHERGDKRTSWGDVVTEDALLLEHVPFDRRARLQARTGRGSVDADWFAYGSFDDDAAFDALAQAVAAMLPQVERWLADGTTGPNVHATGG